MAALPNSYYPSLIFLFAVVSPVAAAAADQPPNPLPHPFPHRFKSIQQTLFVAAPSPPPEEKPIYSPFRPSTAAVVVVVLTATFSITFLFLLYAKLCNRGNAVMAGFWRNPNSVTGAPSFTAGKNSGIDQSVIELLPMFRFGSLLKKEEVECAVCLNKFEETEILRLLPKCKHVFHVECVDTWLDAHSTCPLCRYRVDPEDVLLVDVNANANVNVFLNNVALSLEQGRAGPGRISGRHSSVGEKRAGSESSHRDPALLRRSLDGNRVETVAFDRPWKDGLLLPNRNRFDHRILEWPSAAVVVQGRQRWSDVQPSDLVHLRSEMIMSDSCRFSITEKQSKKQSDTF